MDPLPPGCFATGGLGNAPGSGKGIGIFMGGGCFEETGGGIPKG